METISKNKDLGIINGRRLNARPDTIDFRDKIYSATLAEVPSEVLLDDYKKINVPVLDQGEEGACTGFGLATVIHYLLRMRKKYPNEESVSPRMLYEMAKKYDEWDGEDYVGSSARGAIKGWHKHGVCSLDIWQYDASNPDRELTTERIENASMFPLGAYYRVNHKDLVDMHTAIAEVGVLYATGRVHKGWYALQANGEIPFEGHQVVGGHAFAIVAYDEYGFWIQNSWGTKWGKDGFARITYDDWLANGTDVWVARLGVPVMLSSSNSIAKTFSVATATRDGLAFKDLRPHIISLGNEGRLKTNGTYGNFESDIKRLFSKDIRKATENWKKKRILLYAHGGLVSESSVLQVLTDYRQTLLSNEIYPVFFVWNSDFWSTIKNLIEDGLRSKQPEERVSSVMDFMLDRLDDALELMLRYPGKTAWSEMKENALLATTSGESVGGAAIAAKYLDALMEEDKNVSIHFVAHSAGNIFLAPLVEILTKKYNRAIKSCTLWAPACTIEDMKTYYLPAITSELIRKFTIFTLSDQAEQDDNCFHLYNKSLLYLVSNSFENTARATPILGMAKFIELDDQLGELIKDKKVQWITSPNTLPVPDFCEARHHGDFDNDIACFKSTIARILDADPYIQQGDAAQATVHMPVGGAEAGRTDGEVIAGAPAEGQPPIAPSPDAPQIRMRYNQADFALRRDAINKRFRN